MSAYFGLTSATKYLFLLPGKLVYTNTRGPTMTMLDTAIRRFYELEKGIYVTSRLHIELVNSKTLKLSYAWKQETALIHEESSSQDSCVVVPFTEATTPPPPPIASPTTSLTELTLIFRDEAYTLMWKEALETEAARLYFPVWQTSLQPFQEMFHSVFLTCLRQPLSESAHSGFVTYLRRNGECLLEKLYFNCAFEAGPREILMELAKLYFIDANAMASANEAIVACFISFLEEVLSDVYVCTILLAFSWQNSWDQFAFSFNNYYVSRSVSTGGRKVSTASSSRLSRLSIGAPTLSPQSMSPGSSHEGATNSAAGSRQETLRLLVSYLRKATGKVTWYKNRAILLDMLECPKDVSLSDGAWAHWFRRHQHLHLTSGAPLTITWPELQLLLTPTPFTAFFFLHQYQRAGKHSLARQLFATVPHELTTTFAAYLREGTEEEDEKITAAHFASFLEHDELQSSFDKFMELNEGNAQLSDVLKIVRSYYDRPLVILHHNPADTQHGILYEYAHKLIDKCDSEGTNAEITQLCRILAQWIYKGKSTTGAKQRLSPIVHLTSLIITIWAQHRGTFAVLPRNQFDLIFARVSVDEDRIAILAVTSCLLAIDVGKSAHILFSDARKKTKALTRLKSFLESLNFSVVVDIFDSGAPIVFCVRESLLKYYTAKVQAGEGGEIFRESVLIVDDIDTSVVLGYGENCVRPVETRASPMSMSEEGTEPEPEASATGSAGSPGVPLEANLQFPFYCTMAYVLKKYDGVFGMSSSNQPPDRYKEILLPGVLDGWSFQVPPTNIDDADSSARIEELDEDAAEIVIARSRHSVLRHGLTLSELCEKFYTTHPLPADPYVESPSASIYASFSEFLANPLAHSREGIQEFAKTVWPTSDYSSCYFAELMEETTE